MPDTSTESPTSVQNLPPFASSWSADLGSDRNDSIRIGALLLEKPARKSVIAAVHATAGGESASVVHGLTWSVAIGAYYSYFPTQRGWLSNEIIFSRPIDHLEVQLLTLPSRRPLGPEEVVRVLARSTGISDDRSSSLHLLKAPSQ